MTIHQVPEGDLTSVASAAHQRINPLLDGTRAELGQFLTPAPVAHLIASFFQFGGRTVRILDPGAGVGTLTASLVDRLLQSTRPPSRIVSTCYEVDTRVFEQLVSTLDACEKQCRARGVRFGYDVRRQDYIREQALSSNLFGAPREQYDCVIMNPPYRKISSSSEARRLLGNVGIQTSNLYSAFMLLGARQLAPGGEFASITPRSFCNGPYFKSFRKEFLDLVDIRALHVFESRSDAFKDDGVLQENLILYGMRPPSHSRVGSVSVSLSDPNGVTRSRKVSARDVIRPGDPEQIIAVAADSRDARRAKQITCFDNLLGHLRLAVSTGRVVDFRAKEHLRQECVKAAAPLLFPGHLKAGSVLWPRSDLRKPNAICENDLTRGLLVPNGFYVLVKRFSAKEEHRRIVAALFEPLPSVALVGFDNKLNYFHCEGGGFDGDLARGLTAYLNSTFVDIYFRQSSGHTQVNAADLRRLPYPSVDQLLHLSVSVRDLSDEQAIDGEISKLLS